jgi:type II secretory pathway pseudopilin PulG
MSEAGDTLIEVLIAIVIIALTVTALLGGLVTAITSSSTQQSLATIDSVLNGFTQAARYEVEQLSSAPNWNCRTTPYRLIGTPSPISGPVGSSVTVFVTGFTASHSLSVNLISSLGSSTPATIVNGSTTDSSGDAAVTFTVPAGVTGAQTVSVNDATTPTASPTQFTVGGSVKGTAPVKYSVSVNNPIQQWESQSSQWVATTDPNCPQSGAQLITVVAHAPDGSAGSLNFVATGAANTTVLVSATSSSPSPILGDTLTFTAKVVPPNSTTAPPTGSIQWTFAQSPNSPTCANSALSTVGGTNTAQATCTVSGAGVGLYTVTAAYPAQGTNGNYGTGSGTGTITVGKADSLATVTEVSAPTPAQPGSTLTFTASVGASPAVAGDPKPSGTVGWSITPPSGTAPTCANSQMPTGGTGTNAATCTVPNALVGTYTATATYGGDGNYSAAPPAQTSVSVNKATPTFTFTTTPTNPQPGSNFTVKATVNEPNGGPNPTGTLTWTITPPSGTAPTCAASTLDNTGSGTCTVANALKGTYTINVAYGGNTTYNPANGSTQVVVALAPAGFDIQTVGNPADNKPDNADQIVFTYNQAMSVNSIQNGWNGASETVTAEFTRQGSQTQLAVLCTGFRCNTINVGTVALGDTGSHYVNGGFGGGTVDLNATMVASTNAAGQTVITVTLSQSSGSLSTVNGNTTLAWTPNGNATNTTGVACATTAVNESGVPKKNF